MIEKSNTDTVAQACAVRLEARPADNSKEWIEIFPAQLEWVAKAGHQVRAIEVAAQPPAAPVETLTPEQWVDKLREGTEFAETPFSRCSAGRESVMQRLLAAAGWDAGSTRHKQLEDALSGAGLRITDDAASAGNASEPRFFIDHGMIHDRLTGKHVTTEPDSAFCDGIAKCCELLNSLAERREPRVFPLLFDSNWLADKIKTDPDVECEAGPDLTVNERQQSAPNATAWRVWWVSLNTARTELFEDHAVATQKARETGGCVIPLYTGEPQQVKVTDADVERAWAAMVGSDLAGICFRASVVRGDIRTALESLAMTRPEQK